MSRKAWKTLFSLCGEFFLVSIFFLCWVLRTEVGLNCYSVVDSKLLPKLIHCYEHQLKRLVWGAEGYGCTPNLNVLWQCVDTHWTHVGICTSHSLCNKEQLCFLLVLFTSKRLFVQHSLYFQNIWNCTNVSLLFKAHSKSLVPSHWFCYNTANSNQDILGHSFWVHYCQF